MGFDQFLGNERIVAALRRMLRRKRVPHALLFCGPRGIGRYTLAVMFAQAANCERLEDDFCGVCATCLALGRVREAGPLLEQGLGGRGERPDSAPLARVPLILETHPDVWALVPDPVRRNRPAARPVLRMGQLRAAQRAAYFQPVAAAGHGGEAPMSMLVPTWLLIGASLFFGVDTSMPVGVARQAAKILLGAAAS